LELDFIALSGVIGIILPFLISFLKNIGRTWNTQMIRAFAFGAALVAALVQTGADLGWTNLDFNTVVLSFTAIYTLAQTTFKGLWEGTTIEGALASIFNNNA